MQNLSSLMGCKISSTCEQKDLGAYFSETFKPKLNCGRASKAANKIIGAIGRNISIRDSAEMLILYKNFRMASARSLYAS